jgi:D-alanyl-D-alanine carboxypeptidase (penicillin-binding protein 5/6)
VPIASIAKVITALAVLQKKPLMAYNPGPTITLDNTDLGYYNYYFLNDGSAAKVSAGEQLTEYQALQAMLIPSANNIADSLARWAFGSTDAYVTYANQMVKTMGLVHTTVGDASGFGDNTTSTADDLVKIGLKAQEEPAIVDIAGQQTANIPVAGDIKNVNWLLGSNGVIGLKTGNTDKAGGCFLFAANRQIAGKTIKVVGAVLGQPDLNSAISSAVPLLNSGDSGFQEVAVIKKGQTLGSYNVPWGTNTQAVATNDLSVLVWKGQVIKVSNTLDPIKAPAESRTAAGSVVVQNGQQKVSSSVVLAQTLPGASWHWRIFR